jgi:hypothetical protein
MKKYPTVALLCILVLSCSMPHQNEIVKVELAGSGNWSLFGTALSVDDSLNYKYYDARLQKNYIGKVSGTFWDTLNRKFEEIKFKSIPVHSDRFIVGGSYFELIIHWNGGNRRILRALDQPMDSVTNVFEWLNGSFKKARLHEVNYPLKFETTYQNPLRNLSNDHPKP